MSLQWFVATTHQGKETWANVNLVNQHIETYLPMITVQLKREVGIRPFLPGYIFVRADLADPGIRWRAIGSTAGIRGILMVGERPQVVQDWIIKGIQEREVFGFVKLDPKGTCKFKYGDPVQLKGMPFEAMFVEMKGYDRALILVSLFNRKMPRSVVLSRLSLAGA